MFENLIFNYVAHFSSNFGYFVIFILMVIESSFVPFPSELVIIPAGIAAYMGSLNIFIVILLGTLGSLIGATINYSIGYYFGRKYLLKYKKLFFLNKRHLEKTESFFEKYGKIATFTGRLIPVVKQYISLPAGFSGMRYLDFILYTFLGSLLWVSFLAIIGYSLGQEMSKVILNYFNIFAIISICVFVLVVAFVYFVKKMK